MTDRDKKFERIAQRHIADLKKSSKAMVEDAAVRAVHKVMAEFSQGANTEAKVKYHTTMIQCPHCDGSVRVPAQPYPDNFIDALKYDVARRDSDTQPEHKPRGLIDIGRIFTPEKEVEELKPIAWKKKGAFHFCNQPPVDVEKWTPLYTSPQPRQWQGLARLEFQKAVEGLEDLEDCWIAIEAALWEKNGVQA